MKVKRGDVVYLEKPFPKNHHIQGGNRPFVVISNDAGNKFSEICLVTPLTLAKKKNLPTHGLLSYHHSTVLCEQIFTTAQSNIQKVVYHLPDSDMKKVDKCINVAIFKDENILRHKK